MAGRPRRTSSSWSNANSMARRKNYSFERAERDRQKAAKRLAKREARASARAEKSEPVEGEAVTGDLAATESATVTAEPAVTTEPAVTVDNEADKASV